MKQTRHRYEIPQEKIEEISRLLEAVSSDIAELHKITGALSDAMVQEDDKAAREAISESVKLIKTQSGATQKLHHSVAEISKICLELHESGVKSQDHLYDWVRDVEQAQKEFSRREREFIELVDMHKAAKNSVKTIGMIRKAAVWIVSLVASVGALLALAVKIKGG